MSAQRARRSEALAAAWEGAGLPRLAVPVPVLPTGLGGLRDRVDLTLEGGKLGLYALEGPRAVVDMAACPMMSPALEAWLQDFRADLPPVQQASVRLRVGPTGRRGLWLDAANTDIKALLEERGWLERQLAQAQVELGQRRKPLEGGGSERLRLSKTPVLSAWIQTLLEGGPQDLYGEVGGFSQPGSAPNRVLVAAVRARAAALGARRWLELFAGAGNFTLPLAEMAERVDAWEVEPSALAGLARAAAEAGLAGRIFAEPLNVHRPSPRLAAALAQARPEAILADPPRSGLGGFREVLAASRHRPPLLYVSCYPQSLTEDAVALAALGYRAEEIVGVDQFPHTPHGEWIVTFRQEEGVRGCESSGSAVLQQFPL